MQTSCMEFIPCVCTCTGSVQQNLCRQHSPKEINWDFSLMVLHKSLRGKNVLSSHSSMIIGCVYNIQSDAILVSKSHYSELDTINRRRFTLFIFSRSVPSFHSVSCRRNSTVITWFYAMYKFFALIIRRKKKIKLQGQVFILIFFSHQNFPFLNFPNLFSSLIFDFQK